MSQQLWGKSKQTNKPQNRKKYSKIPLFTEVLLNISRMRILYKMGSACSRVTYMTIGLSL